MGEAEINALWSYLATEERVRASRQKRALAVLLILSCRVPGTDVRRLKQHCITVRGGATPSVEEQLPKRIKQSAWPWLFRQGRR